MKIGPFNIQLRRKAAATSPSFAITQDSVMFYVGDSANNYIQAGYQRNPNLFSIIRHMARAAVKGKIELYDVTDLNSIELIDNNPLLDLLKRPSPVMGKKQFEEAMFSYKWVTGESFIWKVKSDFGKNKGIPGWLIVIPPQYIEKIIQDATGQPLYYKYVANDQRMDIPAADMIHIKYFNPDGGLRGQSPLMAGREILAHDNDIIKANRKLTRNMGPDQIITLGDGTGDYDQTQIDSFETKVAQKYGGPENHGRKMYTSEKVTATNLGSNPDDLGIYEASKLTQRQMCNIYGLSVILFNDTENSTYNNVQTAHKAMITEVVLPEWESVLSEFNHYLVPDFTPAGKKYELRINKTAYEELKADLLDEVTALAQAFWLTVNEKRKAMGYEPLDIPAGDEIFLPVNTEPISVKADAITQLSNANKGQ